MLELNMIIRLFLLICIFGLVSCSDEEKGGGSNSESLVVNSVMGTIAMSGVWVSGCLMSGADGVVQTYTFNGETLTSTIDTYVNDPSCNITPTTENLNLTVTADGDQSLTWFGLVPSGLNSSVVGTRITQTILSLSVKFAFFVDDSSVPYKLYLATEATGSNDADGYPTQLLDIPYTKQ